MLSIKRLSELCAKAISKKAAQAKPNRVLKVPDNLWRINKRTLYRWADHLPLKLSVRQTLKAVIACSDLNGLSFASVKAIMVARLKERVVKADKITERTMIRHLNLLVKLGYLKRDKRGWKETSKTNVLHPDLVDRHLKSNISDKLSDELLVVHKYDHHDVVETEEELQELPQESKPVTAIAVKTTAAAVAPISLLGRRLVKLGTNAKLAERLIGEYGETVVAKELDFVLKRNQVKNPGAYLYMILTNKRLGIGKSEAVVTTGGKKMDVREVEQEAVTRARMTEKIRLRLELCGMIDPRLEPAKHKNLFEACRAYDQKFLEEMQRF